MVFIYGFRVPLGPLTRLWLQLHLVGTWLLGRSSSHQALRKVVGADRHWRCCLARLVGRRQEAFEAFQKGVREVFIEVRSKVREERLQEIQSN